MTEFANVIEAATLAVLAEMDWPDDRQASAHVEPDGYQVTPPGAYWDMAQDVARAVINIAAERIARAIEADSANDASETPDWYAGMHHAADIARQHALQPAETAASATEPAPVGDSTSGSAEAITAGFGTSKTNTTHEETA